MAKSKHYYIRKAHRYLGVFLGIQFLLWTAGGLYFSWSNIDEIHGDFQKKKPPLLTADISLVSPGLVFNNIKKVHAFDSILSFQLIDILGKPVYQVRFVTLNNVHEAKSMTCLINAETGELRSNLTKEEAIAIAARHFNGIPELESVEYLTSTNTHHEYRDQPLPAYAVTFKHTSNTTVYISSELGTIQKFRNHKWRVFDFLWMLHTMDYKSRDNIGNILLKAFSILGFITILSGFVLFGASYKPLKRN